MLRLPIGVHAGVALALAFTTFAVVYELRPNDSVTRAQAPPATPDMISTPAAGSTPDVTEPYWHIPYVNMDRSIPSFTGILNGLAVDPDWPGRSALEFCPGDGGLRRAEPDVYLSIAVESPDTGVNPTDLPDGVMPLSSPDVFLCGDNIAQLSWVFSVAEGTPHVNEGGSNLYIGRTKGKDPIIHAAPSSRWQPVNIEGLAAVLAGPIVKSGIKQYGSCFVAMYDPTTDIMTSVLATAANEEFCVAVAESVVQR